MKTEMDFSYIYEWQDLYNDIIAILKLIALNEAYQRRSFRKFKPYLLGASFILFPISLVLLLIASDITDYILAAFGTSVAVFTMLYSFIPSFRMRFGEQLARFFIEKKVKSTLPGKFHAIRFSFTKEQIEVFLCKNLDDRGTLIEYLKSETKVVYQELGHYVLLKNPNLSFFNYYIKKECSFAAFVNLQRLSVQDRELFMGYLTNTLWCNPSEDFE